ncbi:MAG: ribbon-helix-helix domain-containing protein [Candidatus Peregrinibacteria bacterium]|nr:ribbon-helix-helix domain-containing protein [Candidatus Peregrinibacteria bacterium]
MTTISVPLSADLLKALENLILQGKASNKADAVRKALKSYIEQQAVEDVLRAMNEPSLEGDLDELARKLPSL